MWLLKVSTIHKLKKIARKELSNNCIKGSAGFEHNHDLKAGSPVMVYSTKDEPEFWIVPYESGRSAVGFTMIDLGMRLIRTSLPGCMNTFTDSSYFKSPPQKLLDEIREQFTGYCLSKPVLSYDRIPSKWSWRICLTKKEEKDLTVFIQLESWYVAGQAPHGDIEG